MNYFELCWPRALSPPAWQYNRRFYRNCKGLMGDANREYMKWAAYQRAADDLADLVICSEINLQPKYSLIKVKRSAHVKFGDIAHFRAAISFRQFLHRGSQLTCRVYYY